MSLGYSVSCSLYRLYKGIYLSGETETLTRLSVKMKPWQKGQVILAKRVRRYGMKIHIPRTKGGSTPVYPWLLARYHDLLLDLSSPFGLHQTLYLSYQPSFSQPIWFRDVENLHAHPSRAPPNSRHPLAAVSDPHSRLSQVYTSWALAQSNESAGTGYSETSPTPRPTPGTANSAWPSLLSPVCTSPDLQVQARQDR